MISMIRTTALAAALTLGCAGAMADQVSLNFDGLGSQLGNTPLQVPESQADGKLIVKNAYAFKDTMLIPDDNGPTSASNDVFIMNRTRDYATNAIEISLGSMFGLSGNGQYFQSLSMRLFASDLASVSWYHGTNLLGSRTLNEAGSSKKWFNNILTPTDVNTPWDAALQIDRISISGRLGVVGIDDLIINLTAATTNPNPAPEPASYALVGLALLAAGAATRRRA